MEASFGVAAQLTVCYLDKAMCFVSSAQDPQNQKLLLEPGVAAPLGKVEGYLEQAKESSASVSEVVEWLLMSGFVRLFVKTALLMWYPALVAP